MLHVELERVLRRKRAVFSSAQQVIGLLNWLERTESLEAPAAIGIVRHNQEPVTSSLFAQLAERYPDALIESFEHLDCHAAFGAISGLDQIDVIALDGGGDRRIQPGQPNALLQSWDGGAPGKPRLLDAGELPVDGRAWTILSHALFDGDALTAGKTMGLAAYGQPCERAAEAIAELIRRSLDWGFDRATIYEISDALPLQGFQQQANAAYALQEAFTAAMLAVADRVAGPGRDLVLTGGCALNVTANTELSRHRRIWVPPCPGDEGIAMGAALLAAAGIDEPVEPARFPYLGLGSDRLPEPGQFRRAAELLARGEVLVCAVGRGEVGPRALGNRSFLALPSVANKHRISEQMKGREHFRPVRAGHAQHRTGQLADAADRLAVHVLRLAGDRRDARVLPGRGARRWQRPAPERRSGHPSGAGHPARRAGRAGRTAGIDQHLAERGRQPDLPGRIGRAGHRTGHRCRRHPDRPGFHPAELDRQRPVRDVLRGRRRSPGLR